MPITDTLLDPYRQFLLNSGAFEGVDVAGAGPTLGKDFKYEPGKELPAEFLEGMKARGNRGEYYDAASGYGFIPKYQGGQFAGGTLYYGRDARAASDNVVLNGQPGFLFDAGGKATGEPFKFQGLHANTGLNNPLVGSALVLSAPFAFAGIQGMMAGAGAGAAEGAASFLPYAEETHALGSIIELAPGEVFQAGSLASGALLPAIEGVPPPANPFAQAPVHTGASASAGPVVPKFSLADSLGIPGVPGQLLNKLGDSAVTTLLGAVVSGALSPGRPAIDVVTDEEPAKKAEEELKKPVPMPDPLAQEQARRRSIAAQLGRRGRASTILTSRGGVGSRTLGG